MIALIQRVSSASVSIEGRQVAGVGRGVLALVGIARGDTQESARQLLEKVLTYRIFPDEGGKMNLDLRQIDGELLLVPQFTLVADTRKGTRPGFSRGAPPGEARLLFEAMLPLAASLHPRVASGVFGADMQVALVNDGPVTLWLEA